MRRISSEQAEAIKGQMEQVSNQIGVMQGQLSLAHPGSQTARQLKEDIQIAKADLKDLGEVARSASMSRQSTGERNRLRLARILEKIAGIVDDIDLADDIAAMTLEQVEKAVDRIYGDQSQNETFYNL